MLLRPAVLAFAGLAFALGGCGEDGDKSSGSRGQSTAKPSTAEKLDEVVKIDGGRGLYVRCTGTGSPTVVLEAGDGDASDSYAFAEGPVSRANPDVRLRPCGSGSE